MTLVAGLLRNFVATTPFLASKYCSRSLCKKLNSFNKRDLCSLRPGDQTQLIRGNFVKALQRVQPLLGGTKKVEEEEQTGEAFDLRFVHLTFSANKIWKWQPVVKGWLGWIVGRPQTV